MTNPSISPNNNRITSAGWGYDAAGNTLADAGDQTYVYDGENKMVKSGGVRPAILRFLAELKEQFQLWFESGPRIL